MIDGNLAWQQRLAALRQSGRALYYLQIPAFGIYITTFEAEQVGVDVNGGYGVILYGIGAYGT